MPGEDLGLRKVEVDLVQDGKARAGMDRARLPSATMAGTTCGGRSLSAGATKALRRSCPPKAGIFELHVCNYRGQCEHKGKNDPAEDVIPSASYNPDVSDLTMTSGCIIRYQADEAPSTCVPEASITPTTTSPLPAYVHAFAFRPLPIMCRQIPCRHDVSRTPVAEHPASIPLWVTTKDSSPSRT